MAAPLSGPAPPSPATAVELLRHALATLAYRAGKVLRDEPDGFADVRVSPVSRSAVELVSHLGDLMAWGERLARGEYRWEAGVTTDWEEARDRFFRELAAFDAALADPAVTEPPTGVLFQGPVADALTHVGQLAMMRGVAGQPVRPESYARATIQAGRIGRDQAPPGREYRRGRQQAGKVGVSVIARAPAERRIQRRFSTSYAMHSGSATTAGAPKRPTPGGSAASSPSTACVTPAPSDPPR